MPKILMLKGLPGSGKSTYAKDLMENEPNWKRVNKDLLREMLDAGNWSKKNEDTILNVRGHLIEELLSEGFNVIVDDTNFNPSHEAVIRSIADRFEGTPVEFEIKFFDTPVQDCILRDAARGDKSVGAKVILDMHNKYLRKPYSRPQNDPNLPTAIICDIDGTLAHMNGRGPFDWKKVGSDDRDDVIHEIVGRFSDHYELILVSGRDEVCRPETEEWLEVEGIPYSKLFMRPERNFEKDAIIKERIYNENIKAKYNVLFVLDDRQQVVDMWRRLGLKCLQVEEGWF